MRAIPRRLPTRTMATYQWRHRPARHRPQPLRHLGIGLLVLVCLGCGSGGSSTGPLRPDQNIVRRVNHLQLAMQRLAQLDSFGNSSGHRQVLYHLNQWMSEEQPRPPWQATSLYDQLPARFQPLLNTPDGSSALVQTRFTEFDVAVMQEALWFQRAARDVIEPDRDTTPLRLWEAGAESDLDEATQLAIRRATQLFDWTVRMVRLDPLADTPPTKASARLPVAGSRHYPWESLLIGHGDAYVRMRIFMLLCRQIELESVVLAVEGAAADEEPVPWVVAVLIGDDAYLFDMTLGLPVPGPGGRGVATLRQVMDDTSLLRVLDTPGHRYVMRRSKFERLVALIDGTLTSLSRRMKAAEAHLRGAERLVLTHDADRLARHVREKLDVEDVRLWNVPYDVYLYKQSLRSDAEAAHAAALDYNTIRVYPPLAAGRSLHIVGTRTGGAQGQTAVSNYLQCRVPDWELDQLADPSGAEGLKQRFGSLPEDPVQRQAYMNQIRASMTAVKRLATLWLGQVVFDNAHYDASVTYLRELSDGDDSLWTTQAARYNLARALEASGLRGRDPTVLSEAIAIYRADSQTPQAIGNQLRATWLEALQFPSP